jgi:excisionase family DNA binding protein
MHTDTPLTTGQVARICRVSHVAVWKWIKQGKLKAYRLPGGHYRVVQGALRAFLREHEMPIPPELSADSTKRILIVDDEPTIVEIITRTLQRLGEGFELATATDGFEAGLQVATFKPDLLILDLMMPHVDGFEVCRLVRQNPATAHVRILIVTAHSEHKNIQRALDAGANEFLIKPVNIEQLKAQVQTLLGQDA